MELEEAEDEEWDTSTSQYQYSSESKPNANNNGGKVKCVLKTILVAGFVASSAPLVLPPLVVASAIGLAVSMPYALFLASHTCTQNLMSKLLPRPQAPPLLQDVCFQPHIDNDIAGAPKSIEEWSLNNEANEENRTHDSEEVSSNYLYEEEEEKVGDKTYGGMERYLRGESDGEKPMSGGTLVDQGLDEIVNENEEFETTVFEFGGVTGVILEECCDYIYEVKEGDIEEEELRRETRGLLEKIRDEGRIDVIDSEEMLQPRNDDNDNKDKDMDTIFNEVESGELLKGNLEADISDDSQNPMAEETCELLDERGSVAEEDSSEVNKTDAHENFQEKDKLDDNISDIENQEMQMMHEDSNIMDSSNADARKIADDELCAENPDLHDVDPHTDSVELDSRSSECSSGKNIACPSEEVLLNEGDIWKNNIHAIRKIIGYEGSSQASCVDELKALYIITGVEPPTFVKENPFDPAEINDKLHFLMSIVGIKSNVP